MDLESLKDKIPQFIKKYKYAALILVIGLILMMLPGRKNQTEATTTTQITLPKEPSVSEKLADILSKIDGAGDVHVLLTVAAGEQTIYQTDENISLDAESSTTQIETVILSASDKGQTGLVRQVNPPTYLGAIVVCQGADSPIIQLSIVDAVSKVTGLGADKISVLKMK